ncbi:MAG: hypothetical protein WKF68_08520 [Daejeonella sp.]
MQGIIKRGALNFRKDTGMMEASINKGVVPSPKKGIGSLPRPC